MSVLNLRNVPEELMRDLRSEAALAGYKHLHPFCVALLEDGLTRLRISRNNYCSSGASSPTVTVHPTVEIMGPETRAAVTELAKAAFTSFRQELQISQVRHVVDAAFNEGESSAPDEPENLEIEIT